MAFSPFVAAAREAVSPDACQEDQLGDVQLPWQSSEPAVLLVVAANSGKSHAGVVVVEYLPTWFFRHLLLPPFALMPVRRIGHVQLVRR